LVQFAAFTEKLQKSHDFDAAVWGTNIAIDPDQTSTWASNQFPGGENYGHYANPAVDALLNQARTLPGCDQAARKAVYDKIQQQISEDQPARNYGKRTSLLPHPVARLSHCLADPNCNSCDIFPGQAR
jgi:ABC-type transport system substrate-binding protein